VAVFLNLLPYMKRIEDSAELFEKWNGGIEIPMDGPNWTAPMNWIQELERFVHYNGPKSVHSPIWELNIASSRFPMIAEYSFEVYKSCLEWTKQIGAEQMVLHPSLYSNIFFNRKETQQRSKENLKRLGDVAVHLGVELAVENVGFHECALFDQEEFVALFEEIPTISALVDMGHAQINQWDIPALVRALGSRLTAVHLHDNDGVDDLHDPIGIGTIEWEPIWAALREQNHTYRAILEYGFETPLDTLLRDAEMVQQQLFLHRV